MLNGIALAAIISLFAAVWAIFMARNPKEWRITWMNFLGIIDLNSTREHRRRQEGHLKIISIILCILLLLISASCIYWVVLEVQEGKRERTPFEKDQDDTRRIMDKIRSKKSFNKLN